MIDRNSCLGCRHFYLLMGDDGGVDTNGHPVIMGCQNGFWTHDNDYDSEYTFRQNMARAPSCAAFVPYDNEGQVNTPAPVEEVG